MKKQRITREDVQKHLMMLFAEIPELIRAEETKQLVLDVLTEEATTENPQ